MTVSNICKALAVACLPVLFACAQGENGAAGTPHATRCGEHGAGLTVPPTAATLEAMRIQEDLKNADIGSIYESVAQGSVPAQIELALRLANGSGMAKDDARAVALLQMAADTANPVAIYYLGVAYANGMGVPKDEGMAIPLWEHAARAGYPDAQYWLGFMIANGRAGIASDWCAAAAFFEAAAEQGVSDAAFMLGSAYHQGKLGQNDELAARWYRKAIDGRINQKAQYNLRLLIEAYRVKWQPGDPGVAPPPAPEDKQLRLREKEPDHVG